MSRSHLLLCQDLRLALQKITSSPPILMLRGDQWGHYRQYRQSKPPPTLEPIQQNLAKTQPLKPHIYRTGEWAALEEDVGGRLERGKTLKVVSWNIYMHRFWAEERISAALKYLRKVFGDKPDSTVIMLQEVRRESLRTILEDAWVQQIFMLSNINPPQDLYFDIPDESFILKLVEWKSAPYFTLMLISRDLGVLNCFRVPFVTNMGRDALVIDIPIANKDMSSSARESLRLCTTHLESLPDDRGYRPSQLALISTLLKGVPPMKYKIAAGLVGGDMNSIEKSEHEFHKRDDINLKDVWEDVPAPPVPQLKPFQKDLTYGRAKGNTYCYQSSGRNRWMKRLDKFFYTGSLETSPLSEIQDVAGKLGRLGIGLKTEVDAWEWTASPWTLKRNKVLNKPIKEYWPLHAFSGQHLQRKDLVHVKHECWVSDHFGIAVGVKVV
ncbi:uncharacterized protein Z518_10210 [Rhinocladiella mackenziei CBS 650.93]|uniref:Endonuclease/exonuclease/phosphatase domain-containing protein n=1 Tax=Rhinocladiella mackenziei CBS 650.93 TaxID=1442369 RepID=A0A0D2I5S4_9EURO|nr:uncharacterized protein Z518_10210 [Rhinocladiella mackenziei CBS 650.93]KIX01144.1 hypothetical protein Z518_10210 [Rhinocladiella mackenziei CBS 650.93]